MHFDMEKDMDFYRIAYLGQQEQCRQLTGSLKSWDSHGLNWLHLFILVAFRRSRQLFCRNEMNMLFHALSARLTG